MEVNQPDNASPNNDSNRQRNYHFYGRIYSGVVTIVVGIIFLLNNFGFIHWNAWGKLWPLFVIIAGIFMLLRPRRNR